MYFNTLNIIKNITEKKKQQQILRIRLTPGTAVSYMKTVNKHQTWETMPKYENL